MNDQTARYVFALLCALGIVAIFGGLMLEIGRIRREPARFPNANFAGAFYPRFCGS